MRGDTTDFSRVEFQLLPFFFSEEAEIEAPPTKVGGICKREFGALN